MTELLAATPIPFPTPRAVVAAAAAGDPAAIRALSHATAPLAFERARVLLSPELRPASAVERAIAVLARRIRAADQRLELAREAAARVLELLAEPISADPPRTRWARLAPGAPVSPWIGGFVRFTVLKLLEREARRGSLAPPPVQDDGGGEAEPIDHGPDADPERRVHVARLLRAVLAAIPTLPPRQREAMEAIIEEHLSGKRVRRSGRHHTAAHRARQALHALVSSPPRKAARQ